MRRLLLAALAAASLATPALVAPARAACPDDADVARLAAALTSGHPAEPYAGPLSMADAECARGKLIPLLEAHFGRVAGYKAGLTNEAGQRRYGLNAPVWGAIFASTLANRSGATLELTPQLRGIGVEADLLVRVRDEGINGAGTDHVAILRHLDQVIPFIELPRSGLARTPDGPGLVAANVSARLGVVGEPIPVEATAEFARRIGEVRVAMTDNDREVVNATGAALLGHPLNAVSWLVQDLAKTGRRLRAGDIVSLGGFAGSVPAQAGHRYVLRYEGLAAQPVSVTVSFR